MKKAIKAKIYEEMKKLCDSFYSHNGFERQKELTGYEKKGLSVSIAATSEYPDCIMVMPDMCVENKTINKILKVVFPDKVAYFTSIRVQGTKFANEFGVEEFDDSPYNYPGARRGKKDGIYSYNIEEDTDLIPIVQDHINFMEKVGLKYFKQLSTVKGIGEYFNNRLLGLPEEDFKSEKVMRSFQKEEMLSAITAAHLEKDERYPQIVEGYKKLYSNVQLYLKDIEKLVEYLEEHPV